MATGELKLRVIVVGGSIGGLNAALWLRDLGCDVNVFERTPHPLEGRGAGIVMHPSTIRYFKEHGTLNLNEVGSAANAFRYIDAGDKIAHEEACQYRFTAYTPLYRAFLQHFDADRYHLGEELTSFEQDDESVTALFASGRSATGDVLVCADGVNSTGRRQLEPDIQPEYAGYIAWRGTVPEHRLGSEGQRVLRDSIAYSLTDDGHILAYPIPSTESNPTTSDRLVNWLWYRNAPVGPELDDLLTNRDGISFGTSVPPGQVQERHLSRMNQDADGLPPAFAEVVRLTEEPFIQAIFDLGVPRMVDGRAAIMGDAAFTVRPHAAAGTAKAAEDGWVLAEYLRAASGDVRAALDEWEPRQLGLGQTLLDRARNLGNRIQSGDWHIGEPLPFGLYEIGDSALHRDA